MLQKGNRLFCGMNHSSDTEYRTLLCSFDLHEMSTTLFIRHASLSVFLLCSFRQLYSCSQAIKLRRMIGSLLLSGDGVFGLVVECVACFFLSSESEIFFNFRLSLLLSLLLQNSSVSSINSENSYQMMGSQKYVHYYY